MGKFSILEFAAFLTVTFCSEAQSGSTLMGARGAGMGNSTAAVSNEWSIFNNIGGLSKTKSINSIFSYEVNPSLMGANRAAAGVVAPLKNAAIGIGLFRFGDMLYSEQVVSSGYSNRLGLASLGVKINYIQYQAKGFGSQSAVGLDFGGIASISDKFSIGAYITNLNQPKLTTHEKERLPVRLVTGFIFNPNEKVSMASEVEKDIDHKPSVRAGIEFNVYRKIQFRSGFNLNPSKYTMGIGYENSRLQINYAVQFNPDLRFSHQASIGHQILRSK